MLWRGQMLWTNVYDGFYGACFAFWSFIRKKVIQVGNDMMVSRWWQNFILFYLFILGDLSYMFGWFYTFISFQKNIAKAVSFMAYKRWREAQTLTAEHLWHYRSIHHWNHHDEALLNLSHLLHWFTAGVRSDPQYGGLNVVCAHVN